jgi:NAD(P)H-nitrite reductase large subunit
MGESQHYVIIGSGPAGNEAARHLRERDADGRITMITAHKLLYIRRFRLHDVFAGTDDWRTLLRHPPEYYDEIGVTLRRNTRVTQVDPKRQMIGLAHKEEVHYNKLLVASGGGGYLPESLREYRHLIHGFGSFEDAIRMRDALSDGGRVLMLGGDMMGIDLARHLVANGYAVTLIAGEQLFWSHEVTAEDRPRYVEAVRNMGIDVIVDQKIARIEEGQAGLSPRRVVFDDGTDAHGDVVVAFCGLMPTMGFMIGAGINVQRGLLVSPKMATDNENIWAAGDVCQIYSPEEGRYLFSHQWKSVKNMGRVAAFNMTGGDEAISTFEEGHLEIDDKGQIQSPYWEHDA